MCIVMQTLGLLDANTKGQDLHCDFYAEYFFRLHDYS